MAQQPMTLDQMLRAYQQLTADYQANRINKAGYSTALTRLKALDSEMRWWACTSEGNFVWYDGSRWIPGQPAFSTGQPPGESAPASTSGSQLPDLKTSSRKKGWRRIASTPPILAMLPGAVVGGIWFCYTLFQLILGAPEGVDILTPVILSGLPLLLWLLRKPLDKLLRPLQKFHTSFPFVIHLGIALAVPMLIGCGYSMITTTGYAAMHFTALISMLFSYFLQHMPRSRNF